MVVTSKYPVLLFVSTLFVSVLSTVAVAAAAAERDVSECAFMPDFIPDSICECTKSVPISCKGTTVCYKYTDTLSTIPCIIDVHGLSGLFKMNRCGFGIKYKVNPGMVVCIEEEELRKFYSCFDE